VCVYLAAIADSLGQPARRRLQARGQSNAKLHSCAFHQRWLTVLLGPELLIELCRAYAACGRSTLLTPIQQRRRSNAVVQLAALVCAPSSAALA
jgi:hypothetical protein